MKLIKTVDAVGHVLCHDITQIIKDEKKGVVFKKGHIVREEDIPVLLSVGKENLYIWEKQEGMLHEDEGAQILCKICKNDYMTSTEAREGKIEIFADIDGLFKLDVDRLYQINSLGDMIIATRHSDTPVKKGRIKDTFGPVVVEKLGEFDTEIIGQTLANDDKTMIINAIMDYIQKGADIVVCTGGMSVDPDDRTPAAIRDTGAEIITYGAPVLPGAMLLVSYYNAHDKKIPILGLPGCVMYSKRTVFDIILPRIMADDPITNSDIDKLGRGGLCLNCEVCIYPNCGFGKGI